MSAPQKGQKLSFSRSGSGSRHQTQADAGPPRVGVAIGFAGTAAAFGVTDFSGGSGATAFTGCGAGGLASTGATA